MAAIHVTSVSVSTRNVANYDGLRFPTVKNGVFYPVKNGVTRKSFKPLVVKAATAGDQKVKMAATHIAAVSASTRNMVSYDGLRFPTVKNGVFSPMKNWFTRKSFRSLVVKAATADDQEYNSINPLPNNVLVKITKVEWIPCGGIAQTKPRAGEVVKAGDSSGIKVGSPIVYSKDAGTELELSGSRHLMLKKDDVLGILGKDDDIKDLDPLNDQVLIKVAETREKTAGGLPLTSVGKVIKVGSALPDEEENTKPNFHHLWGKTVLYSKHAGNDFKGKDGSNYVVIRASDVMAVID